MNCLCIEPWVLVCFLYRAPSQDSIGAVGFSVELRTLFLKILKATQKQKGTLVCQLINFSATLYHFCRSKWCFQEFNVQRGPLKNQMSRGFDYSWEFTYVCFKGGIYESCEGPSHVSFRYCGIWIWKYVLFTDTPRNLTWNLKIMDSKWTVLFQGLIFRFHVKFRGVYVLPTIHGVRFIPMGSRCGHCRSLTSIHEWKQQGPGSSFRMWVANGFGLLFT